MGGSSDLIGSKARAVWLVPSSTERESRRPGTELIAELHAQSVPFQTCISELRTNLHALGRIAT